MRREKYSEEARENWCIRKFKLKLKVVTSQPPSPLTIYHLRSANLPTPYCQQFPPTLAGCLHTGSCQPSALRVALRISTL